MATGGLRLAIDGHDPGFQGSDTFAQFAIQTDSPSHDVASAAESTDCNRAKTCAELG